MSIILNNSTATIRKAGTATELTLGDNTTLADNKLAKARLQTYSIVNESVSVSGGTLTLNIDNGNCFSVTLSSNIASLVFQNVPAAGRMVEILLDLTQDGTGSRTCAFPASFKWPGGVIPSLTTTAGATDTLYVRTVDGGATFKATLVQDFR